MPLFVRASFPALRANYRSFLDILIAWFITLFATLVVGRSIEFGIGLSIVI